MSSIIILSSAMSFSSLLWLVIARAVRVQAFRITLFTKAYEAAVYDDARGVLGQNGSTSWFWRQNQYSSVSHARMVFTFWRKLTPENYYADTSFLRPSEAALEDPAVGF